MSLTSCHIGAADLSGLPQFWRSYSNFFCGEITLAPSSPQKWIGEETYFFVPRNHKKSQSIPMNSNGSQEIPTRISIFLWSNSRPTAQKCREDERDQSRVAKDVAQKQCAEAEEVRSSAFFLGKWVIWVWINTY